MEHMIITLLLFFAAVLSTFFCIDITVKSYSSTETEEERNILKSKSIWTYLISSLFWTGFVFALVFLRIEKIFK